MVREPGLHFKLPPPLQNVVFMDRRLQTIDVAASERFLTAEKKSMVVDWFVKLRITDPRKFFVAFNGNVRARAGPHDATDRLRGAREEFVASAPCADAGGRCEREKVMQNIPCAGCPSQARSRWASRILDVRLKRVDLLPAISESVYRRMEAERKRVANEAAFHRCRRGREDPRRC